MLLALSPCQFLQKSNLNFSACGRYRHANCLEYFRTILNHGIPVDVQERIFEPYFTIKKGTEGIGLGLSVVLGIVKGHKGFLEVKSSPGKGTRFDVYFPCTEAETVERVDAIPVLPMGNRKKFSLWMMRDFFSMSSKNISKLWNIV